MRNMFLLVLFTSLTVMAQTQSFDATKIVVGKKSALENALTFQNGLGVSNTSIATSPLLNDIKLKASKVKVGIGSGSPEIQFNTGAVSSPTIKYNQTTSKIEFSNDGIAFKEIGSGSGGSSGINLIKNSTFEDDVTTGWVTSGSTVNSSSYAVGTENNKKYATITSTAAGGYYETIPLIVPEFLANSDLQTESLVYPVSGTWSIQSLSGTTVIASQTLTISTAFVKSPIMFTPAGAASGSMRLRYQAVSSGAVLRVDDAYKGSTFNLKNGSTNTPFQPYIPAISGLGVTSNIQFIFKQSGSAIQVIGTATAGTAAATQFQIPLPNGYIVSQNSPTGNAIVGKLTRTNGSAADYTVLATRGEGFVKIGTQAAGTGGIAAQNGIVILNNAENFTVFFTVEVDGLTGSSTTFDSVCPNDISCENIFAATVNTSRVVTRTNALNFYTCTGSSSVTCTFPANVFTTAPSCNVNGDGSGHNAIATSNVTVTASQVSFNFTNQSGTAIAPQFVIICSKSTPDHVLKKFIEGYMFKTVIHAGISIPRIVRGRFYSTTIGSPCTASPCLSVGSDPNVTVTRNGAGDFNVVVPAGTYSSGFECYFSLFQTAAANLSVVLSNEFQLTNSTNPTTHRFKTVNGNNNSVQDSSGTFMCIGPT